MRKSLFSKIFFTQMLVSLTIILLIVPTMLLIMGEYFLDAQKDEILQDASRVADLAREVSDIKDDEEIWDVVEQAIEFAGCQSQIIALGEDGEILTAPPEVKEEQLKKFDKSFIESVSNGKTTVQMFPKGEIFPQQTLVAAAPIEIVNAVTGEIEFLGASIAFRLMPQVRNVQNRVAATVIYVQITVWILSFAVSLGLTKQILKPIKKMRNAAKKIASGNFNERIAVTTNDEIGQLAEAFNSMTDSLNELESMRSSFVSDVSHELRTPMTIICGFIEGIQDGTIPAEQHGKYLDIVLSEVKRLSRLVNDLLESSRLEQGKIKLEKSNVDMNRLVAESVFAYEKQLTEKGINVNLELDEEECFAYADKDSIKRVMINLIDNAIKFTPEKGDIFVTTERKNKKVYTSVKNSGEGIAKEDLKHIWERFYKTDKSRSVDKKGVGLGLHIVKTIISQHDGEIFAESEEGQYACFTFVLEEGINQS